MLAVIYNDEQWLNRASTGPGAGALNSSGHICGDFVPWADKDTSPSECSEIAKLKELPQPPKHKHLKSKKDCSKATAMSPIHYWSGSVCKSQDVLQFENVYQAKLAGMGYTAFSRDRRSLPRQLSPALSLCRDRRSLPQPYHCAGIGGPFPSPVTHLQSSAFYFPTEVPHGLRWLLRQKRPF